VLGDLADRERTLERLESETFDLLVIGGGVIGARIALEATMNGARVAMVDAGDFGGATSSASSKLIHGGLRYLQMSPAEVPPDVWKHLTHLYGDEAPLVLHTGRLERIHPEGTDVWGQVIHAVEQEWAITVDDVVRRRTTLEIRGQATPEAREAIGQMMASISKMQVAG